MSVVPRMTLNPDSSNARVGESDSLWAVPELSPQFNHLTASDDVLHGSFLLPAASGLTQYEQVAEFCQNSTVTMLGKHHVKRLAVIFKPRCKRWQCEYCAKANRAKWVLRGIHGTKELMARGESLSFITITSHEKLSPGRTIEVLPNAWNKLRNHWQRTMDDIQYILTPHQHRDGRVHIHFITNRGVYERWWKEKARSSGLGYMAKDSGQVESPEHAGAYLMKYISKQLETYDWKKGFRRVRTSQKWPQLPPLARDQNWSFSVLAANTSLDEKARALSQDGYRVALADNRSAWTLIETGELTGNAFMPYTVNIAL